MTHRFGKILALTALIVVATAASAVAEEEGPRVEVSPLDLGFGEHPLPSQARFGEPRRLRGPVDHRGLTNPLATRTILWPTGHIAPAGTVTYTNQIVMGSHLAAVPLEGFELSAFGFAPVGNQTYAGGAAQFRITQGEAWTLAARVDGRYRRTNFAPGTSDAGLGVQVVFDVVANDETTWKIGAAANFPVYLAMEEVDFNNCSTRREWAEGQCGDMNRRSGLMPLSGHWVSLFAGANHFVNDWLIFNVEGFTGVSQGNFWALESALDAELNYGRELEIVESTDWSAGLGPIGIFSLGLGATAVFRRVAVQPAVYLTNFEGEARLFPHLLVAISAGGRNQ